ncbi:MAG: LD-carboxypeptidase [Burkholderiales bacterium]
MRSVYVYSPSGFVHDTASFARAIERLGAGGARVLVDPDALARDSRFAGSDDARLAAVLRAAEHPGAEIALAARGGYGWTRLLDRLDYRAIAQRGKRWVGHSDFTAFSLAMLAIGGVTTYAGPMAVADYGAAEPSDFTTTHASAMLERGVDGAAFATDGPDVVAEGTLWGGNLSMTVSLLGTAYFPHVDGGVLFVEDVNEHPYRIERMLWQLVHSGVLARQRVLLVGAFTGYEPVAHDGGYDLDAAIARIRRATTVPILTGLPFGHVRDKLTLPVGGRASVHVVSGRARLALADDRAGAR